MGRQGGDFDELVGNAAFERDTNDRAGAGKILDLAGSVDHNFLTDGDSAGRLGAESAGISAENGDVGFLLAAFGDDAKGVCADTIVTASVSEYVALKNVDQTDVAIVSLEELILG